MSSNTPPEEIVARLMLAAAKSGAPEYEVCLLDKRSLAIAAKEGKLDQVRRTEEVSAAVRVVNEERLGFAYTGVFTPEALEAAASEAAAGAAVADPQPGLHLPGAPAAWPAVDGPNPSAERIGLDDKIEGVLGMERAARDLDDRVERVRSAEYRESGYTIHLCNSKGVNVSYSGSVFSGSLMVKAVENGEAEMGYEGDFSRTYDQLDLAGIGRAAARRAVAGLGGRQIPTRRGPVLLENSVAAEFLETAAGSFLADNVHKGKSILAGRQGKKIMSRAVTIVDDGLRPGGLVTAPADAEGTPRQTTTVVENGELKTFLYDAQRAAVDHAGSTGNAVRGGAKAPPGLGTTNFIIRPGEKSLEEMMAELRAGLFVTEAMGVHTADPISGDFSFGVSGLLIQGGGIAHPVKGVALAGNVFDMFENVLRVGADLRLFGSTGAPSLLVDGLTVSGS